MSRWSLGLVALLTLAACTAPPQAPRLTVSSETADVTLRLELPRQRSVQFVDSTDRALIKIEGPDLAEPYQKLVQLSLGTSTMIALPAVPVGNHRLVSIQSLDAQNQPIPGAVLRTAGAIAAGASTLNVSTATTALGEVADRILALDKEKKTTALAQVNWASAAEAIAKYGRDLKVAHFALLDTTAIGTAVHTANGAFPAAATAGFARTPGRLELRPTNFPPGGGYLVAVGDAASRPVYLTEARPVLIENIVPGTWTLSMTPVTPGLTTRTQSVTVTANATLTVASDFAGTQAGTAFSTPLGPGGSGVVKVGGNDTLVVIGGTTYNDTNGLLAVQRLSLVAANGALTGGPTLSAAVVQAAVATHGTKLYWFGGRDDSAPLGTGRIYDPAASPSATPATTAPLPNSLALKGASAGTIGTAIYLTGGLKADETTYNTDVLAYEPGTNTWRTATLPALPAGRSDMASAVSSDIWYLFGGSSPGNVFANGGVAAVPVARNTVSAFIPGASARWETRAAMPTARHAATAVTVNGKIWVIGGIGLMGQPTAAVEVYDPAANSWAVKQPLRRARAWPAVGFLNNQIVVAGGIEGEDPLTAMPVTNVEVITP